MRDADGVPLPRVLEREVGRAQAEGFPAVPGAGPRDLFARDEVAFAFEAASVRSRRATAQLASNDPAVRITNALMPDLATVR